MKGSQKEYPLHHEARPEYVTLPRDEYEALVTENARMKESLARHGIRLL